jgi:hypothetical protein
VCVKFVVSGMHSCGYLLLFSVFIIAVDGFSITKSVADSISEESPVDSFTYKLPANENIRHIEYKCLTCKVAVPMFRIMLSFGRSFDEIGSIFVTGCKIFHIERLDVCQGIAAEFQVYLVSGLKPKCGFAKLVLIKSKQCFKSLIGEYFLVIIRTMK